VLQRRVQVAKCRGILKKEGAVARKDLYEIRDGVVVEASASNKLARRVSFAVPEERKLKIKSQVGIRCRLQCETLRNASAGAMLTHYDRFHGRDQDGK